MVLPLRHTQPADDTLPKSHENSLIYLQTFQSFYLYVSPSLVVLSIKDRPKFQVFLTFYHLKLSWSDPRCWRQNPTHQFFIRIIRVQSESSRVCLINNLSFRVQICDNFWFTTKVCIGTNMDPYKKMHDHLGPFWAYLDSFWSFHTKLEFLLQITLAKEHFVFSRQKIKFCVKWS